MSRMCLKCSPYFCDYHFMVNRTVCLQVAHFLFDAWYAIFCTEHGPDNGFVPLGTKPLSEWFVPNLCHTIASLGVKCVILQPILMTDILNISTENAFRWIPQDFTDDALTFVQLSHWGRVMHICVSNLTIIGSDNGLSPGRRHAIICTSAGILLIWTLGANFSEVLSEINTFSFKKMYLKMSSGKWRPSCLGLNVLMVWCHQAIMLMCLFYDFQQLQNHVNFIQEELLKLPSFPRKALEADLGLYKGHWGKVRIHDICCVYRQVSNIRRTKSRHFKRFSYCLAAAFAESLEARCWVENEDVVGAAPTGDTPTISEWSTILLPIKVRLKLEVLRYFDMIYGNIQDYIQYRPILYLI